MSASTTPICCDLANIPFTDCNYKHRDLMIGFRNLFGDHTGANQARVLAQFLKEHDIADKFHYFVGDNASNNDAKLLAGVNTACGLSPTSTHRIRCAGHIINLVIKAIIYGQGVSKLSSSLLLQRHAINSTCSGKKEY